MKKAFRSFLFLLLTCIIALVLVFPVMATSHTGIVRQVPTVNLTPELLIGIGSALLAVLFDWFPGLSKWYDNFAEGQKRLMMTILLFVLVASTFGLTCAGWLNTGWVCTLVGAWSPVLLLLGAIAVNQSVHILTKPPH